MELETLHVRNKLLFNKFLNLRRHELSVYAFENIYIWKGLFDIFWAIIEDNLCIFFKDSLGCFLYLPPQGLAPSPLAISTAFRIMDSHNKNVDISRIENIEKEAAGFYEHLGYACAEKFPEYLCQRKDLVELRGDRFKSKRACVNYFQKHYSFEYTRFSRRNSDECLRLYDDWMKIRQEKYRDAVYRGMLGDSRNCLEILLNNFAKLNLKSGLVKIDKKIRAFTFGFPLSRDTFCILYEISDLGIKGLSQFIFRRFCEEQKGFRYVNIMDDSGLGNLKEVKLSYRPHQLVSSFIARRKR